jgi:alpha-tubulin suppressor-like RCC1 family protein
VHRALLLIAACHSSEPPNKSPAAARGPIAAVDVSLQDAFGCIREASGVVKCWGRNAGGEVGDGTSIPDRPFDNVREAPTPVKGTVAPGALHTSMSMTWVLHDDGKATGWGMFQFVLGSDVSTWTSLVPKQLDLPALKQLAVGYNVMCGVDGKGAVLCAGNGQFGELGDGYESGTSAHGTKAFTPAIAVGRADSLIAEGHDFCALQAGAVTCWGESWGKDKGEIDSGPLPDPSGPEGGGEPPHEMGHAHRVERTPAHLAIANAIKLVAGRGEMCALDRDGAVWCWKQGMGMNPAVNKKQMCGGALADLALAGEECGQLRDGSVCCNDLYGPIDTSRLRGATQLQVSNFLVCGLVDHELRCAGRGGATEANLFK